MIIIVNRNRLMLYVGDHKKSEVKQITVGKKAHWIRKRSHWNQNRSTHLEMSWLWIGVQLPGEDDSLAPELKLFPHLGIEYLKSFFLEPLLSSLLVNFKENEVFENFPHIRWFSLSWIMNVGGNGGMRKFHLFCWWKEKWTRRENEYFQS